ncbi:hypothetical protein LAZ67_4002820 [Cordylochernes scorpioides]|uniref:Mos1 transposase HTH domain-containing protein n=1 Tax=Cordylochernes scorpioides TaxID=51811 RepID=A0ABY6KD99_9ARAC|nr:hypothetical protein LAZ67_4002820 [Cordylochernes scorpioides]
MAIFEEQRICIKFCFKLKKSDTETYELIKEAFDDAALSRSRTFECFSRFQKGREKVSDDQHTGRPRSFRCEENKLKIKELIKSNRRIIFSDWTICLFGDNERFKEGRVETTDNERSGRPFTSTTLEKVEKVLELVRDDRQITAGISFGSTQSIMKDILGVRRLNAVLVPKDLTFDQKNARKGAASLNLETTIDDPELLKRVITRDETWIYGFDSETTQQASDKVKVMLTVFFDYQGIAHHEFQQQGSKITADFYLGVLRRLS